MSTSTSKTPDVDTPFVAKGLVRVLFGVQKAVFLTNVEIGRIHRASLQIQIILRTHRVHWAFSHVKSLLQLSCPMLVRKPYRAHLHLSVLGILGPSLLGAVLFVLFSVRKQIGRILFPVTAPFHSKTLKKVSFRFACRMRRNSRTSYPARKALSALFPAKKVFQILPPKKAAPWLGLRSTFHVESVANVLGVLQHVKEVFLAVVRLLLTVMLVFATVKRAVFQSDFPGVKSLRGLFQAI